MDYYVESISTVFQKWELLVIVLCLLSPYVIKKCLELGIIDFKYHSRPYDKGHGKSFNVYQQSYQVGVLLLFSYWIQDK